MGDMTDQALGGDKKKFDEVRYGVKKAITYKEERTNLFSIDIDKSIKVNVIVERIGNEVTITFKVGDEEPIKRVTSIYNTKVAKVDK